MTSTALASKEIVCYHIWI